MLDIRFLSSTPHDHRILISVSIAYAQLAVIFLKKTRRVVFLEKLVFLANNPNYMAGPVLAPLSSP